MSWRANGRPGQQQQFRLLYQPHRQLQATLVAAREAPCLAIHHRRNSHILKGVHSLVANISLAGKPLERTELETAVTFGQTGAMTLSISVRSGKISGV